MGNLNIQSHHKYLFFVLMTTLFITACSEDKKDTAIKNTQSTISKPAEQVKSKKIQSSVSHDDEYYESMSQPLDKATWSEQGKFKKEFTEDCLVRETMNSENKAYDRKRWAEPCECIAKNMSKHLTDEEAEEYLTQDNNTRSLQIRYESAAYKCLQANKKPQAPKIFKN